MLELATAYDSSLLGDLVGFEQEKIHGGDCNGLPFRSRT
jgi:hypothetical protein